MSNNDTDTEFGRSSKRSGLHRKNGILTIKYFVYVVVPFIFAVRWITVG